MAIRIPQLGLAIYTSPKVLSTSLKYLAFELENNRMFEPFVAQGAVRHIHHLYPAKPFQVPDRKTFATVVAFVRDPVERLASLYTNRVLRRHSRYSHQWEAAKAVGLQMQPDFEHFVEHLDDYVEAIPEVRHHATEQVHFLGDDLSHYDHVFSFDRLTEFEELVSRLCGVAASLTHQQRSRASKKPIISEETKSQIVSYYQRDYEVFGDYFAAADWKE